MSVATSALDLLLLLIILFVVCVFCLRGVTLLNRQSEADAPPADDEMMRLVFDRPALVDCAETRLPCLSDRQCYDNCASINLTSDMHCDEGFCTARVPFVGGHRPEDFVCDQSLGLLTVFTASEFVVSQLCISTYRDVVDDFGEPRPYLCGEGGTLDIDLVNRQFTVDDCTCADNYTKMMFNQGALARAVPVCLPDNVTTIFARVYDPIA